MILKYLPIAISVLGMGKRNSFLKTLVGSVALYYLVDTKSGRGLVEGINKAIFSDNPIDLGKIGRSFSDGFVEGFNLHSRKHESPEPTDENAVH